MSTLEIIWATIVDEFSDLQEVETTTRVVLRLVLAALLGAVLGFEREQQGKAAGIRTHMLVAVGAALFVLALAERGADPDALSRVIQGVAAGIGFLCAGTILKSDDLSKVKGLTTAAGVWLTTAIGVAAGLGREGTAVFCTVLGLIILNVIPHFVERFEKPEKEED